MKWAKYIALGLMGLVVLIAGGLYAAISFIDQTEIKQFITSQVESATGRTLSINGEISPSFSLTPTLLFEQVTLSNASWGKAPSMLEAESLVVSLDVMALFQGELEINRVSLSGLALFLEEKGHLQNWQFDSQDASPKAPAPKEAEQPSTPPTESDQRFFVSGFDVENSVVHYDNLDDNSTYELAIDSLVTQDHIGLLEVTGSFQGAALRLSGHMDQELFMFDLNVSKQDSSVGAKGSLAFSDLTFDATLNAAAPSVTQLASLLQMDASDPSPITLNASLGGQANLISISKLSANYGEAAIQGSGKVNLKNRTPYLQAALSIDTLDLTAFDKTESAPAAASDDAIETEAIAIDSRIIPDTPLPAETLGDINADLTLQIAEIQTETLHLKEAVATLALKDKLLRITEFSSKLDDGEIQLNGALNGATIPATLSANLKATSIPLSSAFVSSALDTQEGRLTSSLELSGSGKTLRDAIASSNGRYDVYVEKARYVSPPTLAQAADFFAMLRGNDNAGDAIDIECAVADFEIKNGVADSTVMAIKTDAAIVDGGGNINLKDETLRIGLRGRSQVIGFADIVPPMVIAGPLQNPKVTLDAQQNLLDIGKFALGAVTGVGLIPILGEKVTDKLGITADNNPCLASIAEAQEQAAKANANPKDTYKKTEDNFRVIRDDVKDNVKGTIKDAEKDIKVIRDGLKGLFKKSE